MNHRRLASPLELARAARSLVGGEPRIGLRSYVFSSAARGSREDWSAIGPVPRAAQRFRPQGLTFADDALYLGDHYRNLESYLYQVDPATREVIFEARTPAGAVHPGGLAAEGRWLWMLDFVSEELYRLDREASLAEGRVVVDERWATGLDAPSALAFLETDEGRFLAFSDYLWTLQTWPMLPAGSGRTYLVPVDRIDELDQRPLPALARVSYPNGGFSQGLAWDGEHLLEAANNLGVDRVEVREVTEALATGQPQRIQQLGSFAGPATMIEDLALDDGTLYTTDEGDYMLYERAWSGWDAEAAPPGRG